jgi:hypothetical protein
VTNVVELRPTQGQNLPEGTVNGAQLAALADITYRKVDFWTRCGYLQPAAVSPGSGYQRVYPVTEVTVALLIQQLTDAGLLAGHAAPRARELATTGTTHIAGLPIHLPEEL